MAVFATWSLGWCAIIVASLVPGLPVGPTGSDKALHFLAYALMVAGAVGFCLHLRSLLLVAVFAVGLGAGLELAQRLVPGRSAEFADALANGLGAAFGLLVGLALLAWLRTARGSTSQFGATNI